MSIPPTWSATPDNTASEPQDGPPRHGAPHYEPAPLEATPYAPPLYGAPQYQAPQYQAPQYGAPAYGAPQYGAPAYAAPQDAAPQYGAPVYGAPQYGAPTAADPYSSPAPGGYAPDPRYAYGQSPYEQYAAPRTNGLAIASLVTSLASFLVGISAPVGLILGIIALRQIRRDGSEGRGMAIAGIVIGSIVTVFGVAWIAFFIAMAMAGSY